MKISFVTIVFAVICVMSIWRTVTRLMKDQVSLRFALLWCSTWFVIGVGSLFPGVFDVVTQAAGMRRMFFVLVVAVFFLFALLFRLMSELEDMKRTQSRLVQTISMLNYRLEKSDDSGQTVD